MTLIPRYMLRTGAGAEISLPPFGGHPEVTLAAEPVLVFIPNRGLVKAGEERRGWRIRIDTTGNFATVAAALAYRETLLAALVTGNAVNELEFCRWYDTTGAAKDIYRGCVLQGEPSVHPVGRTERELRVSLALQAMDNEAYATWSDGSAPGAHAWESSLWNGTSGSAAVPIKQAFSMPFYFAGSIEATGAGNLSRMQAAIVVPSAGAASYKVKGIQVARAQALGAGGNTVIAVSDTDYQTAGNKIALTLAQGARTGRATGTVTLAAGATAYVYFESAGGAHLDLVGCVEFESA
jgi:hypothetical protein